MRPVLLVIAGPNGSGKTTVTERLRADHWSEGVEYLNPDEIAQARFGGWNDPLAVRDAANWTERRREELLAAHLGIAFETVFSTAGKVDFVRARARLAFFSQLAPPRPSRPRPSRASTAVLPAILPATARATRPVDTPRGPRGGDPRGPCSRQTRCSPVGCDTPGPPARSVRNFVARGDHARGAPRTGSERRADRCGGRTRGQRPNGTTESEAEEGRVGSGREGRADAPTGRNARVAAESLREHRGGGSRRTRPRAEGRDVVVGRGDLIRGGGGREGGGTDRREALGGLSPDDHRVDQRLAELHNGPQLLHLHEAHAHVDEQRRQGRRVMPGRQSRRVPPADAGDPTARPCRNDPRWVVATRPPGSIALHSRG
jgi:hypothetical protein